MRRTMLLLLMQLCLLSAVFSRQPARLELRYPGYSLSAVTQTSGKIPFSFVAAAYDSSADARKASISVALIEFIDQKTRRTVAAITDGEYRGKAPSGWKRQGPVTSGNTIEDSFVSVGGKGHMEMRRTIASAPSASLPLGQSFAVSYAFTTDVPMKISVKLSGRTTGTPSAANGVLSVEEPYGWILLRGSPAYKVESSPKARSFSFTTAPVAVSANTRTELLTLTAAGTSVERKDHAKEQAGNLAAYLAGAAPKPAFAAWTLVDKKQTNSGDTVSYELHYHNTGTAPGVDIDINNPIPAGTQYVDGSADGGAITLDRLSPADPVKGIRWKFGEPILPGEERIVRFKARIL